MSGIETSGASTPRHTTCHDAVVKIIAAFQLTLLRRWFIIAIVEASGSVDRCDTAAIPASSARRDSLSSSLYFSLFLSTTPR